MRAALAFLLCCSGCLVPSLDELEQQMPRACDDTHLCATGYTCAGNLCRKKGSGECSPSDTQPCGTNEGECALGIQTCGADSKWGVCTGGVGPTAELCDGLDNDCNKVVDDAVANAPTCGLNKGVCAGAKQRCVDGAFVAACGAASYGADYEVSETKCDGLDNDCDGMTDEGVTGLCPKQQGVCAGTTVACSGGAFPACDAVYAGKPGYQVFEQSCDGLDNDCDGKTDSWDLQNLSTSPSVQSKRPTATVLPNGTLLVLWEEGNKVAARVMNADGSLGATVTPSESINVATKAYAPVVVSDGSAIYAAWAENAVGGLRVMVAPLDTSGKSTIMVGAPPAPSAMPISFAGTAVTALALAVDKGAGRIFLAIAVDGLLSVYSFPLVLPATESYSKPNVLGTTAGKAAVGPAGDGGFYLSVERTGTGDLARCHVGPTGTLSCVAAAVTGTDPQVQNLPPGSVSFGFAAGNLLASQLCSNVSKDGGSCGATTPALGPVTALENVRTFFDPVRVKWVATWVDGASLRAAGVAPWDGGSSLISSNAVGAHPVPLVLGNGLTAVVSDLDSSSATLGNEIVLQRLCAP